MGGGRSWGVNGGGAGAPRTRRLGESGMKCMKTIRRYSARSIKLLALGSALAWGGQALGQLPNAPPPLPRDGMSSTSGTSSSSAAQSKLPKITYTKNTVFHLPVQMEPAMRSSLREVCLYVKV